MTKKQQQIDQQLRDSLGLPDCACASPECPELVLALYGRDDLGPMIEAEFEQRLEPVYEALRTAAGFEDVEDSNDALGKMLGGAFEDAVMDAAANVVVSRVLSGAVPFPPKGV